MKLPLLALLCASAAIASPIAITGSGTFSSDTTAGGGYSFDLWFSGEGMSASCFGEILGWCYTWGGSGMGAFLDGQHFSPQFYSVGLSFSGLGTFTGYDAQYHPVIVQPLIGYLQITSETCFDGVPGNPRSGQVCTGILAITPFDPATVPEPSTWLLTAAGLGLLWRRRATCRP